MLDSFPALELRLLVAAGLATGGLGAVIGCRSRVWVVGVAVFSRRELGVRSSADMDDRFDIAVLGVDVVLVVSELRRGVVGSLMDIDQSFLLTHRK